MIFEVDFDTCVQTLCDELENKRGIFALSTSDAAALCYQILDAACPSYSMMSDVLVRVIESDPSLRERVYAGLEVTPIVEEE